MDMFKKYHYETAKILLDLIFSSYNCPPLITYKQIEEQTGRNCHTEVPHDIGDLSIFCLDNNMPMISVMVINANSGIPGAGFYKLWRSLYDENLSDKEIFKIEIDRVMKYDNWLKLADLLNLDLIRKKYSTYIKIKETTYDNIGNERNFDNTLDNLIYSKNQEILNHRINRHQTLVKFIAGILLDKNYKLFENPMDCLAMKKDSPSLLFEIKTLDKTTSDELRQVRAGLSQLMYYEHFNIKQVPDITELKKILLFEFAITNDHIKFLEKYDCFVLWRENNGLKGSQFSLDMLYKAGLKI